MSMLGASALDSIVEQATERVSAIMEHLMEQLMRDGVAFGDHEIVDDADFVDYYVDLHQQGVLEHLPVVNAELDRKLRERFERVMSRNILSGAA